MKAPQLANVGCAVRRIGIVSVDFGTGSGEGKDKRGSASMNFGIGHVLEGRGFRNSELRNGKVTMELPVFSPQVVEYSNSMRVSRKDDFWSMRHSRVLARVTSKGYQGVQSRRGLRVNTMYKRKADKVRPVDSDQSDGTVPGGRSDWRDRAIEREKTASERGPRDRWDEWFTPKFSNIEKGSRITAERLESMQVGDIMNETEREAFLAMLYKREKALSWDFSEMGHVHEDVAPPQRIRTVPHTAWQAPGFPLPKSLRSTVEKMLRDRLARGTLERCEGPYRNPWFLVKKKQAGQYRMVNAAMFLNKVTVRDATLPPIADEFAERFAGMQILTLADFFSGYDQIELHAADRDMTAFMTPIGLLRMTTLPQGATNSVGQFVRIINAILEAVADISGAFIDDIGIEGPRSRYNSEEVSPGMRRFVLEHLQNLDRVLCEIERAGATLSGEKTLWCMAGLKIVGYVCDSEGRHPDSAKVIKILDWPACVSVTEVKSFLGVCVYYRIWIQGFSIIAAPLYKVTKKGVAFVWSEAQDQAMFDLKVSLTQAPALVTPRYGEGAGLIVVAFDASQKGWGGVLMQCDEQGRRHPCRFESGVWTVAESKYERDAGKRECRALLKVLKKFRAWLYGIHFLLETDALTLAAQLKRTATDIPGALVTQWLAWIRFFDFDVKHIAGTKNVVADALSRRPPTEEDKAAALNEPDIDEWVSAQLSRVSVRRISQLGVAKCTTPFNPPSLERRIKISQTRTAGSESEVLDVSEENVDVDAGGINAGGDDDGGDEPFRQEEYSDQSNQIAAFLLSGLQRPPGMDGKEYRNFKKNALKYVVLKGHLFRRSDNVYPNRRVIDGEERRATVLQALHDDAGHRGREATFRRAADRYYWDEMWKTVQQYVKTCEPCQLRSSRRVQEALHPTWVEARWMKVAMDVTPMPPCQGKHFIVAARSDFSGWVEARAITKNDSRTVSQFLWEDVICRHGCFAKLVVDGGPENKSLTKELAERHGIRRVVVSAYHPQANGMVERGHRPISDALSKMTNGGRHGSWTRHLSAALWADRTTVRASTGMTPYEIEYCDRPMLPIEMEVPSWSMMSWEDVKSTTELIAFRARALERRDEDLEEARLYLRRMREKNKEYFDENRTLRTEELAVGMLVLLHHPQSDINMSSKFKLAYKWLGPYRVHDIVRSKGTYLLEDLDGTRLRGTFAGNRIKRFYTRRIVEGPRGHEYIPNILAQMPESMNDEEESEEEDMPFGEEEEEDVDVVERELQMSTAGLGAKDLPNDRFRNSELRNDVQRSQRRVRPRYESGGGREDEDEYETAESWIEAPPNRVVVNVPPVPVRYRT